jgi:hypothetical protein
LNASTAGGQEASNSGRAASTYNEDAAMFAPPVAKQKTKSGELQRAPVVSQRHGQSALSPVQLLQRRIGNQALMRLLVQRGNELGAPSNAASLRGILQPNLKIGTIKDPLEYEADRVAGQVMRMPAPEGELSSALPQVSRKCAECEEEEMLQKKEAGTAEADAGYAPASVHEVLRSPGQPLDASTRGFMEPRFGQEFSGVRVHTDAAAAQSARDVNAYAYTVGNHIAFATGAYAPDTDSGQQLLAHELAHVIQQTGQVTSGETGQPKYVAQRPSSPRLQRKWRQDSIQFDSGIDRQYDRENGNAVSQVQPFGAYGGAFTRQEQGILHQKVGGEAQVANWVTAHYIFKNDGEHDEFLQLRIDGSLAGSAKAEALRYARAGAVVWGSIIERTAANPTPAARELFEIKDGGISAATVGDLGLIEAEIPFGERGSVKITIPLKKVDEGAFVPFSESEPVLHDVPSTVDEVDVLLGARVEADADIETAFFGISPLISQDRNNASAAGHYHLRFDPRLNPKAAAPSVKGGYLCTTRCQQQCPGGVEGYVEGTSDENCAQATKNAKSNVRKGCYPRHCSCKDTDGFRGTGTQCEKHTR